MATLRICSIPDCRKRVHGYGWCHAHYCRWKRHGDPLAGPTVKGRPYKFIHEIAVPYKGDECLQWPFAQVNGYGRVGINGKVFIVSRLICEEVYGPPPSTASEAAHSCGNGHLGCVNPRHLSWKTHAENIADIIDLNKGEKNGSAKLSERDVEKIRDMKGKMPQREIGKLFGVSQACVSNIHRGATWR